MTEYEEPQVWIDLRAEYPLLYGGTEMQWGFQCHIGWYQLLRDLSLAISLQASKEGLSPEAGNYPVPTQIKEKFGSLRYYMRHSTPEIQRLVRDAENRSEMTCEMCGMAGELINNGGCVATLCQPCRSRRNNGER